ncbi:hypothetical protein ACET3Z_009181 [Daucus carota]
MGGAETSAVMGTVHTCSEAQADHEHLKRNLDIYYLHKDEKMRAAADESLKHLFDVTHIDNMKVLRALIYSREDTKFSSQSFDIVSLLMWYVQSSNCMLLQCI